MAQTKTETEWWEKIPDWLLALIALKVREQRTQSKNPKMAKVDKKLAACTKKLENTITQKG
jgi:hypothetical protein